MKSNVLKTIFLLLFVVMVASLTANAYLWRELSMLTTAISGSGERYSLIDRYAELKGQINRRLGLGKDAQLYITPDNPAVAAKVKELTTDYKGDPKEYWKNIEIMYRWIVKEIAYIPDSYTPMMPESMTGEVKWVNDYWRTPEETLRDKMGDCEDMASLFISMIFNYNKHIYGVWMVEVRTRDAAHVGVVFPIERGMITVMDPSTMYNTAVGEGEVLNSVDAPVAINAWLDHIRDRVPGGQVTAVYSDKFYRQFNNTGEFLNWIKAGAN